MRKTSIMPFLGGVVVGAVVLLIVIFQAGWVMTSSSAEEMAEEAVVDRLAPICVKQFRQDPGAAKKLKKLDESFFGRGKLIMDWGFATMPGEKTPDNKVADRCAEELLAQRSQ